LNEPPGEAEIAGTKGKYFRVNVARQGKRLEKRAPGKTAVF
jgi:hypothetical protein